MNSETNFYELKGLNNNIDLIDDVNEEEISLNSPDTFGSIRQISKHIKVTNSSNFSIKFLLTYSINNKNLSLNSGEYSPSYARQISIPKEGISLKLNIYFVAYPEVSHIIYTSNLRINQTYEFTVTGTIENPVITEN